MLRSLLLASFLVAATVVEAGQNVVVVLDDSGSMSETMRTSPGLTKMNAAKRALLTVLDSLPPDAKLGIVRLNGDFGQSPWIYPLGPVDQDTLRAAIQSVSAAGTTPLGEKMKAGADALLALRDQQHYGSYRLLIVTDGDANDQRLVDAFLPDILTRGIWVDVIGVDMAGDHKLASNVHTYRRADDPNSLEQAIREVFAESSDGTGDAAESDFELLAAIPDEVAVAALNALTASGNYPIGEGPTAAAADPDLAAGGDGQPGPDASATPPADVPEEEQENGRGWSPMRIIGLLCIAAVIFLISKAKKGRRR